ncbi:uncharacterized protein LOC133183117 [Saccostrea echinata]|uniref:uncharacterized protein LOC133183117 n=1 Tax=Saccostrea echinata TaxID=191078 RepID=UPI002A7EF032|nr:uncharacterized protein LOC133183117 [Saccostrea echinata]
MARLREGKLYKLLKESDDADEVFDACYNYAYSGKDLNARDEETGESFMHLLAEEIRHFTSARGVGIIYLMACKGMDLDIADINGDTFLHKICRKPHTHRVLVSVIRSGADPLIRNKKSQTPADVLLEEKPEGWEETLHYYNMFKPGLYRALQEDNPDRELIRRLLKFWCRVTVVKNRQTIHLKSRLLETAYGRNLVELIEEYENTNEFIPALLECEAKLIRQWIKDQIIVNINVNTKDYSYQFAAPNTPIAPRPLLVAVWETRCLETVDIMMELGADTSVLFSSEPDKEKPKPLFFHVLGGPFKPSDEIAYRILRGSNLNVRDLNGRTVLFEAISQDSSEIMINFLLSQGIRIGLRDKQGFTAYDIAKKEKKLHYCKLLDNHVISLVRDCDMSRVEDMILLGYDRVLKAKDKDGVTALGIARNSESTQLRETLNKFKNVQEHICKLFQTTHEGDLQQLKNLLGRKYYCAQDICGRNVLHIAVMHQYKSIVEYLSTHYPQLLNMQDNLGRTPLHYAEIFLEGNDIIDFMIEKGASVDIKDVQERTSVDYQCDVCGQRTYLALKKEIQEFRLDVFLAQTNFERAFMEAVKKNDLPKIKDLVKGVLMYGNLNRYSHVLFDCVDKGQEDIAVYLIEQGMDTRIYKQYQACIDNDPDCAVGECSHTVTSFKERVINNGNNRILNAMSERNSKAEQVAKQRTFCPDVQSFNVFGLL